MANFNVRVKFTLSLVKWNADSCQNGDHSKNRICYEAMGED